MIKSPYSAIVDAGLTTVVAGTQAKVVAWYDNEWAYSTRLVELAQRVLLPVPSSPDSAETTTATRCRHRFTGAGTE